MPFDAVILGIICAFFLISSEVAFIKARHELDAITKAPYSENRHSSKKIFQQLSGTVFFFCYGVFAGNGWYPLFSGGVTVVSMTNFMFNLQALHTLKYHKCLRTLDEPVEISRLFDFSDLSSRMFFAAFFLLDVGPCFRTPCVHGRWISSSLQGVPLLGKT